VTSEQAAAARLDAPASESGLRVCMLAYTFYETDGRVIRYAEALARAGAQVDAITLYRPGQARREIINGVEVVRIQERQKNERSRYQHIFKMLCFFFRSMVAVTRRHLTRRYDVIHVHSLPDFEVFAACIAKLLGARLILDIHDLSPEFYANKFGKSSGSLVFRSLALVERSSVAFADHVIAANDLWFDKLQARCKARGKLTTFLNYPDRTIFRPGLRATTGDAPFVFVYPGSLNRHQGLDIAVNAFKLAAADMPDAEFHIYGEGGAIDDIRGLIETSGMPDRIRLRPPLPIQKIAQIMADSDVGIVPKRDDSFGGEAFSTKILEFMALGVPLIVSATRIDKHYFTDSLVRFFEPGSEQDLARAMREAFSQHERNQELVANALRHVENFTWTTKQQDYLSIVRGLTAGRPRRAT
jgi:glycosyltransferase involved in cell wall biosynthesis